MALASDLLGCDTSDMLVPHGALRRGLSDPGPTIRGADAPDALHSSRVVAYYSTLLRLGRLHDSAEDALLWPRLHDRAPRDETLLLRMEGQHRSLDAAALDAWLALAAYRGCPDQRSGAGLGEAICQLRQVLSSHLVEEEREILPIAGELFSQPEWDRIAQHALGCEMGARPWLMVGLFAEEVPAEERPVLVGHLPGALRRSWQEGGEAAYTEFMAALRPGAAERVAVAGRL